MYRYSKPIHFFLVFFRLVLKAEGAKLDEIRGLVRQFVPSAKQARLFGRELSFVLPRDKVDRLERRSDLRNTVNSLYSEFEKSHQKIHYMERFTIWRDIFLSVFQQSSFIFIGLHIIQDFFKYLEHM